MNKNKKIVAPPVFRPLATPKVLQAKTPVAPLNSNIIQRNCGAPGCDDPDCDDPKNHGIGVVRNLRNRTIYSNKIRRIKKGTGTSAGTRKYVNSSSTPYPKQVSIEYSGIRKKHRRQGGTGGFSEFINYSLKKGQKADAGHIFGNQYGGIGNQNPAVFPQHPQTNRGNYHKGQPTRHLWRFHEDEIRKLVEQGKKQRVTVKLSTAPRMTYTRYCSNCYLVYDEGAKVCSGCKQALT